MKTKMFNKIFSFVLILLGAFVIVGCTDSEPNPARDKAKQNVETLLSMDFGETNANGVVLEPVTKHIGIAQDEDGVISEKDLETNTYSEFLGGVSAKFESSHPEIMDAQWVETSTRAYTYAEDGKTVIGITKQPVWNLMFVVNRPEVDTVVSIKITATKEYESNGINYRYSKSRTLQFTVAAKEVVEVKEMTLAEINEYATANWDDFAVNGIVENGATIEVLTKGVVTEVLWGDGYDNHSFMMSDGAHSLYVYAPATGSEVVEIGDLVEVRCKLIGYYSIMETAQSTAVVKVLLNGQDVPEASSYTVDGWYEANPNGKEFHGCPGQRVVIEGILQHDGTRYVLQSETTDKYFEIYYKGYTAYEESLIKANLGKKVKMEASIYDYHSQGYYRLLANVYDYPMTVLTLEGQAALDADINTIVKEYKVKDAEAITLPATTLANGSTVGAWTASVDGHIDLTTGVCTLNGATEDVTVTLTATVTLGELSETVTITVVIDYIPVEVAKYEETTEHEVGVAYKFAMVQGNLENKVLYFAGSMSGKYLATTEVSAEACDVYLEAATEGYYLYILNGETKTYINIAPDTTNISLDAAPLAVWAYNEEYNTFTVKADDGKDYYLGSYKTFNTMSKSQLSFAATSFVAHLYKLDNSKSIAQVVALEDGVDVVVKGTVTEIVTAWNDNYKNISFNISDGTDTLYIYRCVTDVKVGDIVTITGQVGSYKGAKQIAAGSSAVITGSAAVTPTDPVEKTLAEIATTEDDVLVTVKGTVSEIVTAWSDSYNNISFNITDGTTTLYIFRCNTKVNQGDVVTVTGKVDTYNEVKQIGSGSTAVVETGGTVTPPPADEPVEKTLAEIATTEDDVLVTVKGTVSEIVTAWSDQYNNISFNITDGTTTLYIFRCNTNVNVGDVVTVTGKVDTYNEVKQIGSGSTAVVETGGAVTPPPADEPVEMTIAAAVAAEVGTKVIIKGQVIEAGEWNSQYGNISFTVKQGDASIYVFRCPTNVKPGDLVTITGVVDEYNNSKQIAADCTCVVTGFEELVVETSAVTLTKVTKVADLVDGMEILLTYTNGNNQTFVPGTMNSSNFINKVDYDLTSNELPETIYTITLEQSGDKWLLKYDGKYLAWKKDGGNKIYTVATASDDYAKWTITFETSGEMKITNVGDVNRFLTYNASSPRFAAYKAGQQMPVAYKVERTN